jgi:hypothetical protein
MIAYVNVNCPAPVSSRACGGGGRRGQCIGEGGTAARRAAVVSINEWLICCVCV